MNPQAINKASKRLEKAKEAYKKLQHSTNFREFESAWIDFLLAVNGVHTAIKAGRSTSPKNRQWCGMQAAAARKDQLLRYLHHARNEDEHGLEPILAYVDGRTTFAGTGGLHIKNLVIRRGVIETADMRPVTKGGVITVTAIPAHAKLLPVKDSRDGNVYDVPMEHLSKPILDQSPVGCAALAIDYYIQYIKDAAKLIIY